MNILSRQATDRRVIDVDFSARQFVESDEQVDQRSFSCAGRTNDGHFLPRFYICREVIDNQFF
ncbi:hypothetical protein D3C76_1843960 [compost metagenome]